MKPNFNILLLFILLLFPISCTITGTTDGTGNTPLTQAALDYLEAHNRHRRSVPSGQPIPNPALPELTWNQKLADYAKWHADQCVWQHSDSTYRSSQFGGAWIGENLAANTGYQTDPFAVVDRWVAEAADYTYATDSCTAGKQCGHYTQVVWRNTLEVGCAKTLCTTLQGLGWSNAEFWVCEYSPGGNYVGQRPY